MASSLHSCPTCRTLLFCPVCRCWRARAHLETLAKATGDPAIRAACLEALAEAA